MKKIGMLFFLLFTIVISDAQSITAAEESNENNMNTSANSDNVMSENSGISLNEQFDELKDKPIDLNKTDVEVLVDLFHLTSTQIQSFINYRNTVGYFLDFHELQSIPGWDVSVLKIIRPYVYVSASKSLSDFIHSNLKDQKNLFLFR